MGTIGQEVVAKLGTWRILGEGGRAKAWESWRKRDLALIYENKDKIKKFLSRSQYRFNVYILAGELEGMERNHVEEGPIDLRYLRHLLSVNGYKERIGDNPKSINVILRGIGNAVGKQGNIPPTPWIVVHWIAHGVLKSSLTIYHHLRDALREHILECIFDLEDISVRKHLTDPTDLMSRMFTFKSARRGILRNSNEGWHDLMVQFIVEGRIRLAKDLGEEGLTPPGLFDDKSKKLMPDREAYKDSVGEFKREVESIFDKALRRAVGRHFII